MKKITGVCFTLLAVVLMSGAANAASNFSYTTPSTYNSQNTGTLQGQVTYVPAGTVANVMISNPLDSRTTTVGSAVSATLTNDLVYNGKTIASKGSRLSGTVVKSQKAKIPNRNGQIQVVFNNLQTSQGYNIPVNAVIKTDDNTGVLKGATKMDSTKEFLKNTVVGTGAGAALGTAMGALSGGSVGKGAVYGTAIGGGLGLIKGGANKGEDVIIPASALVDVYFTQPITLSAPAEYKYNY